MWYKSYYTRACPQTLSPLTCQVALSPTCLEIPPLVYSALALAVIVKCMYVTWGGGGGWRRLIWVRINAFLSSQQQISKVVGAK